MEDAKCDLLASMTPLPMSAGERSSLSHHLLHPGMFPLGHAFVFCAEAAVNTLGQPLFIEMVRNIQQSHIMEFLWETKPLVAVEDGFGWPGCACVVL